MNRAAGWFVEVELRMLATRTDLQREYPDLFDRRVRYNRWAAGSRLPVLRNHEPDLIGVAEVVTTPAEVRAFIAVNGSPAAAPVRDLLGRGGVPGASPRIVLSDSPLARDDNHTVRVGTLRELSLLVDDSGRPLPGALGDACRVVSIDRLAVPEVAERAAAYRELRAPAVRMAERMARADRVRSAWRRGGAPGSHGAQHRDTPLQEQRV